MRNLIFISLVLLFASPLLSAQDIPAKAATCVACHGARGVSENAQWPNLAGQKAAYLVDQITAFRDGERSDPLMAPVVAQLTDSEIANLASYYAAQTPAAAANGDSSLVAKGENLAAYCKACHGVKGQPVAKVWPNLAGQQAQYLQQQLSAFKRGERVSPLMHTVLMPIDEENFAALAAYYSQLSL